MVERLFPVRFRWFLVIAAAVALVIGVVGAIIRGDSAGSVVGSGVEAALLAAAGAVLARSFISLLLWTGRDSPTVSFVLGWAFFIWPGAIDTIPKLRGSQFATTPAVLLWIAASVGSFTGMMDGLWQTHQWLGPGVPAFVLDETWGLPGTTNGDLLHVINFAWAGHAAGETRTDAHRYQSGFRIEGGFAFTQGAVMSDLSDSVGQPRWRHENTHVWQNRIFGPIFTFSYLAWLIVFLLPGLIYGLFVGDPGGGIQGWSYFSNPWEAWAYSVQGVDRTKFPQGAGIWPDWLVVLVSVVFFIAFLAAAVWLVFRVWKRARANV